MGHFFNLFIIIIIFSVFVSCGTKQEFPVYKYYNYDQDLPLKDSVHLLKDTTGYKLFYVTFQSVHNQKVTALLTVPKESPAPHPVIILMHGAGDRKTVDYVETGNDYFLKSGYAILRLDIANHGDRLVDDYDFSFTDGYRYWTRDIVIQTVFDLRRAVDFIQTRKELDSNRIGYYGISLGGIIGTIFSGVEPRVKVPVIALAGGGMHLMFGMDALSVDTKDYLSMIEPLNFVEKIAPRPLLMINAENDDIVPPMMSKLMFKTAKEPKEILWYPSKHHDIPVDKVYPDGVRWFQEYL
ncbi:MAG: acetylxylan esterase [Cyclobacteriaceae bacterium]|nr:acetylxylan esterase [Cyclobacteriaceae bacterium]